MSDYTSPSMTNDVTMQGSGVYSANSDLQHQVMVQVLPLIEKAAKELASQRSDYVLTVAEYGAAQGANSIGPLEIITNSFPPETLHILLNDKPNNDFNTLSSTITDWTTRFPKPPFLSMIPGSFYDQILPPNSVDLGFSLTSIQHLSETRPMMDDNLQRIQTADTFRQAQAHKDFTQFLHHRATETKPGGSLLLSFPATSPSGPPDLLGPTTSIVGALKLMLAEGKISTKVLSAFNEPLYNRSIEDVRATLDGITEQWEIRECIEDRVVHPAYLELEKVKNEQGLVSDEVAWKYTHAIIDWVTAVIAGYMLKALRDGDSEGFTEEGGAELVEEWIWRAKKVYFEHFRGETVSMAFIYVWLRRR